MPKFPSLKPKQVIRALLEWALDSYCVTFIIFPRPTQLEFICHGTFTGDILLEVSLIYG